MTKRAHREGDGNYHVGGAKYQQLVGSRAQVWHGTAFKTSGGLKKKDLVKNKWGNIVSRRKQATAKREKRLEAHGFFAKKGKFGYVFKEGKTKRRRRSKNKSRRRRR